MVQVAEKKGNGKTLKSRKIYPILRKQWYRALTIVILLFVIFPQLLITNKNVFASVPPVASADEYTSPADGWWNGEWQYRKKIVFNNTPITENLIDFPVLVHLTSSVFDFTKAQSSGQDIRLVDSDNATALNYEIEQWDSTKQLADIWVNVPQVDSGSTSDFVYLYYGNPAISDG